ncbi:DUF692 domain-containing protein [Streptomyces asoensis]|uniref:DUF692 domain-containing protein n=1 Tax=Streptomyces asoensis TaxID=249586 RepID=A0A6M4WX07_9ACTN|nr:DUF692 domain-containing protein [Streptomyces asoensis]QJT03875.1 DUF692 domain-containing protein [Streptomyces asoensis]
MASNHSTDSPISVSGAGLGYRKELSNEFSLHSAEIDVVEILADQWFGYDNPRRLREVADEFSTVLHGVGMSLAGAGRIPDDYLEEIRKVTDACGASYYSEHLAMTHVPGADAGHLCPPVISEEGLRACIRNVDRAQTALGVPLALENITYSFSLGADHVDAATFFTQLVAATGCYMLLDVANLYINSKNHSFDPLSYLDKLPTDRIVQVHLAGGVVTSTGQHIDSHSETIGDEIWRLAADTAERCSPSAVIVERDDNFPDFEALIKEVAMARDIFFPKAERR